ncbi:MAG: hypothetical protein AB1632_12605 [Nitrospirota bacterium]
MKICALCRKEIEIDKYFSRDTVCTECGGDLHICFNCKFYSESSHNKCMEPKAEFQRVRDRANFCDYFFFKEVADSSSPEREKDEARRRLDELFRK